jgi:hypothetical protein
MSSSSNQTLEAGALPSTPEKLAMAEYLSGRAAEGKEQDARVEAGRLACVRATLEADDPQWLTLKYLAHMGVTSGMVAAYPPADEQ